MSIAPNTTINTAYEDLLREIRHHGTPVPPDRTNVGTRVLFGRVLRYDLQKGFPLITTKRVFFKGVKRELRWILNGSTNVHWLQEQGVHIWDEWAGEDGELGPVYGKQWRDWETPDGRHIDQIDRVMESLRDHPYSRRHVVSAWNVSDLDKMALQPCHAFFQFNVLPDPNGPDKLSCMIDQRSADMFLGVPFNIASYALLIHLMAHQLGYAPGELVWVGGNCHVYDNHHEAVDKQLSNDPYPFPTLTITGHRDHIADYDDDNIKLSNRRDHPRIEAPVAV